MMIIFKYFYLLSKTILVLIIFIQSHIFSCQTKNNPHIEKSKNIVSKYEIIFDTPPQKIPMPYSVDAPLLGNGDMAVAIGGDPEKISFWLSKNDFWRFKSEHDRGYFSGIGHLDIEFPDFKMGDYRATQNLYDATTKIILDKDDKNLKIKCFVAATTNLFIVEIEAEKKATTGRISLHSIQGGQSDSLQGRSKGILWMVRKFEKNVEIPSAVALALNMSTTNGGEFRIEPGEKIQLYLGMASLFKNKNYIEDAINLVDLADLDEIVYAHRDWWQNFWAKSYVSLNDTLLEKYYYLSLYTMGSSSRDPEFPPSLFGPWVSVNKPWWSGDYHLNYNHMAPFYSLYSSNRIEQALPYIAPILDFHTRGQYYAQKVCGIQGVLYPVGIGPKGIETTRKSPAEKRKSHLDAYEDEGMFWGQKSNAAYCVTNISAHFYHTYDAAFTRRVYPFVIDVVKFWEKYLVLENGQYNIYNDAIHEGTYGTKNPILSLGLVPYGFTNSH